MSAGLTGGTGAATRHGNGEGSKSVIARVPLQPRLTCDQKHSRPTPKGETAPMPVMTTRGPPECRISLSYATVRLGGRWVVRVGACVHRVALYLRTGPRRAVRRRGADPDQRHAFHAL